MNYFKQGIFFKPSKQSGKALGVEKQGSLQTSAGIGGAITATLKCFFWTIHVNILIYDLWLVFNDSFIAHVPIAFDVDNHLRRQMFWHEMFDAEIGQLFFDGDMLEDGCFHIISRCCEDDAMLMTWPCWQYSLFGDGCLSLPVSIFHVCWDSRVWVWPLCARHWFPTRFVLFELHMLYAVIPVDTLDLFFWSWLRSHAQCLLACWSCNVFFCFSVCYYLHWWMT